MPDSIPQYLAQIESGTVKFKSLSPQIKTAIVGYLKSRGDIVSDIAHSLSVTERNIYYYWEKYQSDLADFIKQNAGKWIGRLVAKAEMLFRYARDKQDFGLCWRIETDLLDRLIKLGLLESKPDRVDLRVYDNREPEIIEAELAQDLTLLQRVRNRANGETEEIKNAEVREIRPSDNGNGTRSNLGESGLPEHSDECGNEG